MTSSQQEKDTSRNIKATGGFTVNIISEPWVEQANAASIDAPRGVSEWPITGLTRAPSVSSAPAWRTDARLPMPVCRSTSKPRA